MRDDEIWIFHSAIRYRGHKGLYLAAGHDYTSEETGSMNLARLRLDGFVSLDATDSGSITTKPFEANGGGLHINADAAGGEIRCDTAVQGLQEYASEVVVETLAQTLHAHQIVACAGLMADRLVRMLNIEPDFIICPFRGEYYRLRNERHAAIAELDAQRPCALRATEVS